MYCAAKRSSDPSKLTDPSSAISTETGGLLKIDNISISTKIELNIRTNWDI